ncbi:LamB/YcsF family protein [Deferrisoma sp.]
MAIRIDLNADMGESFGAYRKGDDEQLMEVVTSANIACGFHAGDPHVMRRTVALCADRGVAPGAHPGYPDLLGFGRRGIEAAPEEVYDWVLYQVGALEGFARARGLRLQHVKPHGALYNRAAVDAELAAAVAEAVRDAGSGLILLALAGSELERAGRGAGLRVAREAFLDRAYRADGTLVPRSVPGSVLQDPEEVTRRAVRMCLERRVHTLDGEDIPIEADSFCIHGDSPGAAEFARRVRTALEAAGVRVEPLAAVVGEETSR